MKVKKFAYLASALYRRAAACMPTAVKVIPLSLLATTTLHAAVIVPGYLKYEYFPGETRTSVEDGTAVGPAAGGAVAGSDKSGPVGIFESGTNFAENYANRFSGFFIPPTTGDYVFFIAGDDDSDLFLSTDADPANKKLIAQEAGWSAVRSYNSVGGTSTIEDKRSDKATISAWPGATGTGATITLTAGQRYYIESVHHEGGGGDNLAVTYKLASEPDPKNGDSPRMIGSVIAMSAETAPPAATLSIAVPPVGGTFYTGQPLTMFVVANSDSTVYPVLYQWRFNGNPITGANGPTFQVGSATTANAGNYDVVVSVASPTGLNSVTSAPPVAVTVQNVLEEVVVGKAKYEYFPGSTRPAVEAGSASPSSPGTTVGNDASGFASIVESGTNFADNYANRFSGLFIAPTTGNYVFYIAGDDDSDLFLSTDENPANKKLIAQEAGWSAVRAYNTVGGGSVIENKRSDSFAGSEWPGAAGAGATITLTANKRYYFEAVHHEGGGGDNLAVTYRLDTESEDLTANGTAPRLTGNVIAASIPQIMSISAGVPTVQKFPFNITDSGVSILDPATVKLTFDGQVVSATPSPKANGATAFTYTFPTRLAPGTTHYYTIQATDTKGQPVTRSAQFSLPQPWFPTADLKAPPIKNKLWASRFIHTMTDASGATIQATGLANIIRRINQVGTPDLTAEVIDLNQDVVNFNAGGFFGNPVSYPEGMPGDDFINLNVANIEITEEGDYTFGVHSDDGFGLRIRGGEVVRVSGAGSLDPADPEAVVHPADTGDSTTRAVYHLKKGVFRIEFFWWERGGGDFGEIYAAKGNFSNDGDTPNWRLVGDNTPAQELTLLGVDNSGWSVISSDNDGDQLNDWATAQADLTASGGGAKSYDLLNVGDPDTNGGVLASPKDRAGVDDNDFALRATATLVVPEDGTYILGFNSDDGAYLKIAGQTFLEIQQNNTGASVIGGDTVTCDCLTGNSGTTMTVALKKGNLPIEVGMFERGGGAFLQARGAKLPANPVSTSDIPILAKGAAGTKVTTIAALQITDKPTGITPGGDTTTTISRNGNTITIGSSGAGTVQATPSLTAPTWTDLGPAPQNVEATGAQRYFRIRN